MLRHRPSTPASARSVEPPRRVVYAAEHPCQYADLWLPSGSPEGPLPVAVLVHGGSWTCKWCSDLHDSMAGTLAAEGWAVWNLEYRRVGWEGQPGGERAHEGAGYPGTLQDVGAGLNGLAALHDAEPELRLDLGQVVIIGHSSGGHLALWASQAHRSPLCAEGVRVKPVAVVALGPATDLLAEFGARRTLHSPRAAAHWSLYRATLPPLALPRTADGFCRPFRSPRTPRRAALHAVHPRLRSRRLLPRLSHGPAAARLQAADRDGRQ